MRTPIYDRRLDDDGKFFLQHGCMFAPPHYHHALEILCVPAGKTPQNADAALVVNGVTEKLDRPIIALVDSDTVHSLTAPAADCYCAVVPKRYLRNFLRVENNRVLAENFVSDPDFVARVSPLLFSLPSLEGNELAFTGAVDLLLGLLGDKLGFAYKRNRQLALDILSYIKQHCTEDIRLQSLAQKIGYHKCYLSKLIRETFDVNFATLVNAERYRLFCALQAERDDLLANIYNAGFNSTSTFYRFCRSQDIQKDRPSPAVRHRHDDR